MGIVPAAATKEVGGKREGRGSSCPRYSTSCDRKNDKSFSPGTSRGNLATSAVGSPGSWCVIGETGTLTSCCKGRRPTSLCPENGLVSTPWGIAARASNKSSSRHKQSVSKRLVAPGQSCGDPGSGPWLLSSLEGSRSQTQTSHPPSGPEENLLAVKLLAPNPPTGAGGDLGLLCSGCPLGSCALVSSPQWAARGPCPRLAPSLGKAPATELSVNGGVGEAGGWSQGAGHRLGELSHRPVSNCG